MSVRITQIKRALTLQIDFPEWKPTFINNDFTAGCEMGYFYHSVGIKCFCQCTTKEINHLRALLSMSQNRALQSYIKHGCSPSSHLLFLLPAELHLYQDISVFICGFFSCESQTLDARLKVTQRYLSRWLVNTRRCTTHTQTPAQGFKQL